MPTRNELAAVAGPLLLAFSLNGFFLYVGALDLLDIAPETSITGAYYGLLGLALLAVTWRGRSLARARLTRAGALPLVFGGALALLVAWHSINAAVVAEGPLAHRLGLLFVLWVLPSVLVAACLPERGVEQLAYGLVTLGIVFVLIEFVAIVGGTRGDRLSPIAELDAITAGQIPAFGAVAAVGLLLARPSMAGAAATAALVAGAITVGSRGPLLALSIGVAVTVWLAGRTRTVAVALAAVAAGVMAGSLLALQVGSTHYLTYEFRAQDESRSAPAISSTSVRLALYRKSLNAIPEEPLRGHGVGMLVDDTPEARRLGISGTRTYPHNTLIESAYSLGFPGLVLFALAVAAGLVAAVRVARRRDVLASITIGLLAYAGVNSNVSAALGSDPWLWSTLTLCVVLACARTPETATAPP